MQTSIKGSWVSSILFFPLALGPSKPSQAKREVLRNACVSFRESIQENQCHPPLYAMSPFCLPLRQTMRETNVETPTQHAPWNCSTCAMLGEKTRQSFSEGRWKVLIFHCPIAKQSSNTPNSCCLSQDELPAHSAIPSFPAMCNCEACCWYSTALPWTGAAAAPFVSPPLFAETPFATTTDEECFTCPNARIPFTSTDSPPGGRSRSRAG